jgi:CRISPR-associated endonuclease/helicase Cas3
MPVSPTVPLAHSAGEGGGVGDPYARHIQRVRAGTQARAEVMLTYAASPPSDLLGALDAAAAFHDLGKLDVQNQTELRRGREARLPWDHIDAGVAHLGQSGNWMAAWLVRAHHAPGLPCYALHFDPDELGRKLRGRRRDERDLKEHQIQIRRTDERLAQYLADHEAVVGKVEPGNARVRHGLTMRLALSCLVDADHADTAWFDTGCELPQAPLPRWDERLAQLDEYVGSLTSEGAEARVRDRIEFYAACRDAGTEASMVACEGPVGLGKTTAVTAHLLRHAIKGSFRHLIIVAPYTNIISQTAKVLRCALTLSGESPEEVVAEHHHRADFSGRSDRELAVLWRAPIILTTAVQFFETLASNHPGQLRKLHEVPGSGIFLDEAHAALPAHLWPQNWRWLRELTDSLSCRVVFASGSLARFWENDEIVDTPVKLPELLPPALAARVFRGERSRIHYATVGRPVESVNQLVDLIARTPGPRLAILNTVQSAAVVARTFHKAGHRIFHLSTALCPRDRDAVTEKVISQLDDKDARDWTLVATSCVESGVDFSFRTAFRERFSTASLIQVGGRVNRHGEFDASGGGCVFDILIDPDGGITENPAAKISRVVLGKQFRDGRFTYPEVTPAQLVSDAMAEEIGRRGGLGRDAVGKAEAQRDYPTVADEGRVIRADTRLVVVDPFLREQIEQHRPLGFRTLLEGSVQIWVNKVSLLKLPPLPGRRELYFWPYEYDPEMLGYMAGVLCLRQFMEQGGAII